MAWTNTNPSEEILVSDDSYWQFLEKKIVPSAFIDGRPISWTTEEAKLRVREKTTQRTGVTAAYAETIGGDASTISTSGSFSFESYSKRVSRRRANPAGGYDIVIIEKWAALFVNGTWTAGATDDKFIN